MREHFQNEYNNDSFCYGHGPSTAPRLAASEQSLSLLQAAAAAAKGIGAVSTTTSIAMAAVHLACKDETILHRIIGTTAKNTTS